MARITPHRRTGSPDDPLLYTTLGHHVKMGTPIQMVRTMSDWRTGGSLLNCPGLQRRQARRRARRAHRGARQAAAYAPRAVQFHTPWGSIRFRAAPRTCAPRGCIVRVGSLTKSRKIPNPKNITARFRAAGLTRGDYGKFLSYQYASRAVQCRPHGGQSDFVWLPARTMHPHVGPQYVWCLTARRNQEQYPPETCSRSCSFVHRYKCAKKCGHHARAVRVMVGERAVMAWYPGGCFSWFRSFVRLSGTTRAEGPHEGPHVGPQYVW